MSEPTAHEPEPRVRRMGAWLRRVPQVWGKQRLARQLLRNDLAARDLFLSDCDGNSFLVPHLAEPMAFALLTNGIYEVDTRKVILECLATDSVFVDVGANIGLFTVPAARRAREGNVIAVEASSDIAAYLESNVTRNRLSNVRVHSFAAFDRSGDKVKFYSAPSDKFGMGSLAPQFGETNEFVETMTLDDLIPEREVGRVRVVKIDVEGFEARVLRGARRLLTRAAPPLVLIEFWDWAEERADVGGAGTAQSVLREMGYRIWRLQDWRKGKAPLTAPLTQGGAMLVAERI